jgi:hypothetical protein
MLRRDAANRWDNRRDAFRWRDAAAIGRCGVALTGRRLVAAMWIEAFLREYPGRP